MSKDIKTLQAALNLEDPEQLQMYNYVKKRPNSSDYIKRLIWLDMKGSIVTQQTEVAIHQVPSVAAVEDEVDEDLMSGFI